MSNYTYIPRRLDDQWKIGFWELDVVVPVLFFMFAGFASGSKLGFLICICIGLGVARWVSRLKANRHPAFVLHWMYWHLPSLPFARLRCTPPSHVRRMVG